MNDIHIPSPCQLTNTQCNFQWVSKSRVTPDSYHSTLSLRDNHDCVFSFRVTPDFYHSILSLRDNMTVCFLSRATELFGLHCEPLTSTHKFQISPRVFYTHTEISDISTGLLHPHRNFGQLHGSLTPTQKFGIAPRVSYTHSGSLTPTQKFGISLWVFYTHIEILDFSTGSYTHTEISNNSTGLLHPHRNLGYLPGSLTPTHKFGISPRVSYTHTKIRDISPGLLHPQRNLRVMLQLSQMKRKYKRCHR